MQAGIVTFLRLTGWHVSDLSQPRATCQTAGLPDLYAMHPEHGSAWIEVKTQAGRVSKAQAAWHATAATCGVRVVVARCTADVLHLSPHIMPPPAAPRRPRYPVSTTYAPNP